jgi:hypothetical protein
MAMREGDRDSHFGCEETRNGIKHGEGDVLCERNITSPERF